MIKTELPIYLASKSPRRKKLLQQLGIDFQTITIDLEEELLDGEHPVATVKRLASHKFEEASKRVNKGIIITADTIVVLNKKIIGKPVDEKDAFKILKMLSGKTHLVYTGFVVGNISNNKKVIDYEKTEVTFRKISDDEILEYISGGSPMDKAGAYGIQDDYGAVFVKKINGCYYNVVGLPVAKIYKALKDVL